MSDTVIIIPSRLNAKRFPNKPLSKINGLPMIVHVMNKAKESDVGEVFVATPDNEIADIVKKNNGNFILTNQNHPTGTDRVFEAFEKKMSKTVKFIINLQGDMPNIKVDSISKVANYIKTNQCDICTLCSFLKKEDIVNKNVVKVQVKNKLDLKNFFDVEDFFRESKNITKIYHHIGIYAFTSESIKRYINTPRSKKEMERNLEQMRAMENKFVFKTGLSKTIPLSVDTKENLIEVEKEMAKND